jgi:hypothetical protein
VGVIDMTEIEMGIVERLQRAHRCRPDIESLAAELEEVSPDAIHAVMQALTREGQDHALGFLLNACAVNKVKLDPEILTETLKVIYDVTDFSYCFSVQDESAIPPLLAVARAEELSWERQGCAARVAAELAVKTESDREPVRKLLWYLIEQHPGYIAHLLLEDTLFLLDDDEDGEDEERDEADFPMLTGLDLLKALPERPERIVSAADGPIRRPIPKMGRNEPCHCGSGKKYKRCCYDKDQETLRDASQYEGVTRTELRESPGVVSDPEVIHHMRAYEIKKLDPATLSSDQIFAAYRRADAFGLREIALKMLIERVSRPDADTFDPEHFGDLLDSAIAAGDTEMARKIQPYVPEDVPLVGADPVEVLEMLEHPERLEFLEGECRRALLQDKDSPETFDYPVLDLAYHCKRQHPALSIVLARAAIAGHPERVLDNELLCDVVHESRIELGLEPWGDPIDDLYESTIGRSRDRHEDARISKEVEALKEEIASAREAASASQRELRQKEGSARKLKAEIDAVEQARAHAPLPADVPPDDAQEVSKETLERLRRQVQNLKADANNQRDVRGQLQKQLRQTQRQAQRAELQSASGERKSEELQHEVSVPAVSDHLPKTVLVPDYTDAFRQHCESLPQSIVAKALKSVAAFAANDKAIWRHSKPLEAIEGFYRIRIGIHYRLLVERRDHHLSVLDLIPRADLETWIKQHMA